MMSSLFCFKDGDSKLLGKVITSRIQIRNSLPEVCRWKFNKLCGGILVIAVYQRPGSAIVGTQHRSTMISLYNDMCAKDKEFR
ncbi:hypothetical protein RHMOL_Rhmol09G0074700 [Rhododendron molle]|uniref:Uncharacterized protein n=1 Tax=Rhododendron molle TaxID=49168 RepID=A0ACC0MBY7_RHOML|nr:hypothetical protein RHMOL_Rhmol09G0074700 [Rhododendron molle]